MTKTSNVPNPINNFSSSSYFASQTYLTIDHTLLLKIYCSLASQNNTHFWVFFLLLWLLLTQSWILFSSFSIFSLGNFMVLKYHLYADVSQMYIFSLDFSSEIKTYLTGYLTFLLRLKISKNEFFNISFL